MTNNTTPAWLARARARARARTTTPPPITDQTSRESHNTVAATTHLQPTTPKHTTTEHTAPRPETAGNKRKSGRGNHLRAGAHARRAQELLAMVSTDVEELADRLVAGAARPEMAALLRADLPGILRVMIAGAYVPGPAGMSDRATLFRLGGLPTERAVGDGDAAKARLGDLASRLERAAGLQARLVESHLGEPVAVDQEAVGRDSGAVDAAEGSEGAENRADGA